MTPLAGMTVERLERLPGGRHGTLALRRCWPADERVLTLEYADGDGTLVGGRWAGGVLTLRAAAADLRLPGLAVVMAEPDASLIGYRPGRRGVVRTGDGFAKVVRPARAGALLAGVERATRLAAGAPFAAALPHAWSRSTGVLRYAPLAGVPLGEWLHEATAGGAGLVAGAAVRALHVRPAEGLAVHDAAAEVRVVECWARLFAAHAAGGPARAAADRVLELVPRVAVRLLAAAPTPPVPLHRDLNDGHVLIDGRGHVALLDFDRLAAGEAALDVASLLVSLELAELLGTAPAEGARAAADGVREGYALDPVTGARLDAYADAARLRLVCVHAFRPAGERALALLDRFAPVPGPRAAVRTRALERA